MREFINDYIELVKKHKKIYIAALIIYVLYNVLFAVIYLNNKKNFNKSLKDLTKATYDGAKKMVDDDFEIPDDDYSDF